MKLYNVGILGATGAVGQEMMKILLERKFPVGELRPIASARSAGSEIDFGGRKCTIVEASDDAFGGLDSVLGAAENDIAERFAPAIVKAGAVFVDNSSAFRLDSKVPLVIPEINPEDVKWHSNIISNPNCTTIVSLVAINALNHDSPIESIVASSYQAVSGAGAGGPIELMDEVEVAEGCPFHCRMDGEALCDECRSSPARRAVPYRRRVVELPVSATEDRVVGTLDLERALKDARASASAASRVSRSASAVLNALSPTGTTPTCRRPPPSPFPTATRSPLSAPARAV